MTNPSRRAIAYIASNIITKNQPLAVFDYSAGNYFNFSFSISGGNVSAFDYTENCFISGSGNKGSFSLFHYGNKSHISLSIQSDGSFNGYDYHSGKHFSGSVRGNSIIVYDYESSAYFNYSI